MTAYREPLRQVTSNIWSTMFVCIALGSSAAVLLTTIAQPVEHSMAGLGRTVHQMGASYVTRPLTGAMQANVRIKAPLQASAAAPLLDTANQQLGRSFQVTGPVLLAMSGCLAVLGAAFRWSRKAQILLPLTSDVHFLSDIEAGAHVMLSVAGGYKQRRPKVTLADSAATSAPPQPSGTGPPAPDSPRRSRRPSSEDAMGSEERVAPAARKRSVEKSDDQSDPPTKRLDSPRRSRRPSTEDAMRSEEGVAPVVRRRSAGKSDDQSDPATKRLVPAPQPATMLSTNLEQNLNDAPSEPQSASPRDPIPGNNRFTTTTFASMPLGPNTQKALAQVLGIQYATEVQQNCIPVALAGDDIVGQAKTGTGKTLAFLIPVVEALSQSSEKASRGPRCLVLTPTRELAMQILTEWEKLTKFNPLGGVMMVGGTGKGKDIEALRRPNEILVATPGRLLDHLDNTPKFAAMMASVQFLVLDEMDRLLDEGFWRDVERIIGYLPPSSKRQTLLFSATIPKKVLQIADRITRRDRRQLIRTTQEEEQNVHQQVSQQVIVTPLQLQMVTLINLLREEMDKPGYKVMVFFTTARQTQCMAEAFQLMGIPVLEIHSRKSQAHRTRVSDAFRTGEDLILFSSDVSARGMDYPNVSCVVQVGLPASQEQYIHRLGRTARGTCEAGHAVLLLADFERPFLREVASLGIKETAAPSFTAAIMAQETAARRGLSNFKGEADRTAQVYVAWLGFYIAARKKHGLSDIELVQIANKYIMWLFNLNAPPSLKASTVGKMGLRGVPGITVDRSQSFTGGRKGGKGRS